MIELAIYSLIVLSIIRIIGLILACYLLFDNHDFQSRLLVGGWISWTISALCPLLAELTFFTSISEILLLINIIGLVLGVYIFTRAFTNYFIFQDPLKVRIGMSALIVIPAILYFVISLEFAIMVTSLIAYLIFFISFIEDFTKHHILSTQLGKSTIWFYVTYIIIMMIIVVLFIDNLQGKSFGLYTLVDSQRIIIYYSGIFLFNILLAILMLHIETTSSKRKLLEIKDKYSHDLGNTIQIITSALEIIKKNRELNENNPDMWNIVHKNIEIATELIKEIRKLDYKS